jgi:hypothetical protein
MANVADDGFVLKRGYAVRFDEVEHYSAKSLFLSFLNQDSAEVYPAPEI